MRLLRRAVLAAALFVSEIGVESVGVESVGVEGLEGFNCCVQPYSFFDCTGSGHEVSPGKLYTCVKTAEMTGCMTCLGTVDYSNGTCSTCCSVEEDSECTMLESDWEFYASTLFFVCLCCCFTALCGYTEVRRKKKGISFAEAWSVPQAMPILRTWPGRSLSASDMLPGGQGGGDQHWAQLSDNEEDLKQYPVAGLVDDSGVAFGFVASMPQSLLSSLAPPRHPDSNRDATAPPSTEPELTIRVPRAHGAAVEAGDVVETAVATRAEGYSGADEEARLPPSRGGGHAVGNDLQEPLMFGDGTAPNVREAGVDPGSGGTGGVLREGVDAAEVGRYR